jgi:hypothetical protein
MHKGLVFNTLCKVRRALRKLRNDGFPGDITGNPGF